MKPVLTPYRNRLMLNSGLEYTILRPLGSKRNEADYERQERRTRISDFDESLATLISKIIESRRSTPENLGVNKPKS
jgi:hypothetical protein